MTSDDPERWMDACEVQLFVHTEESCLYWCLNSFIILFFWVCEKVTALNRSTRCFYVFLSWLCVVLNHTVCSFVSSQNWNAVKYQNSGLVYMLKCKVYKRTVYYSSPGLFLKFFSFTQTSCTLAVQFWKLVYYCFCWAKTSSALRKTSRNLPWMVSVKLYPSICHLYIYDKASKWLKRVKRDDKITLYYSDLLLIRPIEIIKNDNIESSRSDTVPISENNFTCSLLLFLSFYCSFNMCKLF